MTAISFVDLKASEYMANTALGEALQAYLNEQPLRVASCESDYGVDSPVAQYERNRLAAAKEIYAQLCGGAS